MLAAFAAWSHPHIATPFYWISLYNNYNKKKGFGQLKSTKALNYYFINIILEPIQINRIPHMINKATKVSSEVCGKALIFSLTF
jgi:hypothetical protein